MRITSTKCIANNIGHTQLNESHTRSTRRRKKLKWKESLSDELFDQTHGVFQSTFQRKANKMRAFAEQHLDMKIGIPSSLNWFCAGSTPISFNHFAMNPSHFRFSLFPIIFVVVVVVSLSFILLWAMSVRALLVCWRQLFLHHM